MELRIQYATTRDNVRIAYAIAGSGTPIVRIPNPMFSHIQLEWRDSALFERMAETCTIVPFDPRGTGLSDRHPDDFSLEARVLDVEAVADRLPFARFVLHAVGWSGATAVAFATRYPERVSKLILDGAFARGSDYSNTPQIRALSTLAGDWDALTESQAFAAFGVGGEEAQRIAAFLRACVEPATADKIMRALGEDDVTDLLGHVTCPTLVLQHTGLRDLRVEFGRELASRIPGAHLVLLGGRHGDDTERLVESIEEFVGIARRAPVPSAATDSRFRAILFTDVEGHTSMMSRLGDERGRAVLREHERITRETLARHAGVEVKSLGDGFMATFASASSAVACAIALQRAFAGYNETAEEPIRVRAGLNAGEPIAEGDDYFGSAVIMASRLSSAAAAGEILVSTAIRELCAGKGFSFDDRGDFELRGISEPARAFSVRWED